MYNNLITPIRARSSWESIDLGIALARKEYWTLFKLFFIPSILFGLIIYLILPTDYKWLMFLIVWWLKPLFERPLLYYLSRHFFGHSVTTKEILRNIPELLKNGLLFRLSFARLSMGRSFYLPVRLLEKQSGEAYRKRRDLLSYNEGAHNGLTIIGLLIENILAYSLIILVIVFFDSYLPYDAFDSFFDSSIGGIIFGVSSILMQALFAPFYIAAGFMLYLNRRIKLEGWDIEIAFKGIVSRLNQERKKSHKKEDKKAPSNSLNTIVSLFFCVFTLINIHITDSAYAQETTSANTVEITQDQAAQDIQTVYESEDVQKTTTVTKWKLKNKGQVNTPSSGTGFYLLSEGFKFAAIVVIVSVLIYLIYFYRDVFVSSAKNNARKQEAQQSLSPIAKRLSTLPDDYLSAAKKAWAEADYRSAMSLIYRGSLSSTLKKGCKNILAASTENECLEIVKNFNDGVYAPVLKQVTQEWQLTAYANRTTSQEVFSEILEKIQQTFFSEQVTDKLVTNP